jgi:DNA-binding GntR family transcriptional regulator
MRIHDFTTDDRVQATIAEHLEILDAVLAGDADAAASFMRAHVQRSALVVRERVGAALSRMAELQDD